MKKHPFLVLFVDRFRLKILPVYHYPLVFVHMFPSINNDLPLSFSLMTELSRLETKSNTVVVLVSQKKINPVYSNNVHQYIKAKARLGFRFS